MSARPELVVIGVGNPFGCDDGAGPAVVARLAGAATRDTRIDPSRVELLELDGEPSRLVEAWAGRDLAIVVDAVRSGAEVGHVRRIEVGRDALPDGTGAASSHAVGLAEAVGLGRALGRLPARLVVFGIEGGNFTPGPDLSAPVLAAVEVVAARIHDELAVHAAPISVVAPARTEVH